MEQDKYYENAVSKNQTCAKSTVILAKFPAPVPPSIPVLLPLFIRVMLVPVFGIHMKNLVPPGPMPNNRYSAVLSLPRWVIFISPVPAT